MKLFSIIAAAMLCLVGTVFPAQAQKVFHKSYGDFCIADYAEITYRRPYLPDYYNYAGQIEVEYDASLPSEVIACIRVATDIVEQNLLTVTPLRVKIGFKHFDRVQEGIHTYSQLSETEVRYVYDEEADVCYPSSLYRQTHPSTTDEVVYDGSIYMSEDEVWNCTHNARRARAARHDLTTYILRGYMRILGMASAVDRTDEGAIMGLPALTPFDHLVSFVSSGDEPRKTSLSSLELSEETPSAEAAKVIMLSSVAEMPDGEEILLYTGKFPGGSYGLGHIYDYSVMTFIEDENVMCQRVDEYTRAILNAIGWGADRIGYKRNWSGEDLAYYLVNFRDTNWKGTWSSKDFTLESKEPLTVKESSLTQSYRMADGSGYRQVQTSTSYPWHFEFPTEEERAQCELNIYGCIYAYFTGYAIVENEAGEEYRLPLSYRASIGRPPKIIDARLEAMEPYVNCLTVICGGKQAGIEVLKDEKTLYKSDKYSSYIGRFVEYFESDYISSFGDFEYPVDIRISVTNDYGSDEKIINVPSADFVGVETVAEESTSWDSVELYGINGQYLGTFLTDDILEAYPAGLYILLYKSGHDIVKREKVCK